MAIYKHKYLNVPYRNISLKLELLKTIIADHIIKELAEEKKIV